MTAPDNNFKTLLPLSVGFIQANITCSASVATQYKEK